jgi:hypothetical protein
VLSGLESRCAACGRARFLLSAPSVSLAGEPSRWGGAAATLAGVCVLVLGLSGAAGLWLLLQSIWPGSLLGAAFGVPLGAASLLFGLLLLLGGRRLRQRGSARRREVERDAVQALVQHRRGPISAFEAARSLRLPEARVDGLLTELARERATAVTLDVDEQGHLVYDFDGEAQRWRVLEEQVDAAAAEQALEAATQAAQKRGR